MSDKPRILCVDDEPNILEALSLSLRRRYDVVLAAGGPAALDILTRDNSIVVIVSDMRMPQMDGATFLAKARELAPDATRMLLTGHTDLDPAVKAINEGQIFRFLTKPCPPPQLLSAIDAAAEQSRLRTAERVLLEQTLHGSIKALVDILSITNPIAFGHSTRIKRCVSEIAEAMGLADRWQLEVAAMLSQLGFATLPAEIAEKVYYGHQLSDAERAMVAGLPRVTEQLIANIPRLEGVRAVLTASERTVKPLATDDVAKQAIDRAAAVLRVATDYDSLETRGASSRLAIDTLRGKPDRYDVGVLNALSKVRGVEQKEQIRDLPIAGLRPGMVFAEDVKMTSGALLVARGYEVTPSFIERARNFKPGSVKEPVRIVAVSGAMV